MHKFRTIQVLLWIYFWLLIFEGALRKWMFPGLSNELILARDPIAILAIWIGFPVLIHSKFCAWILYIWIIAFLAFPLSMLFGHGDWLTAAYGTRILFFHIPLIFLFGIVFSQQDIWKFGKALLLLAIPMTGLIIAQYFLPSSHILNIAPGGDGTAGFSGAMGKMRPPGTFSFITGVVFFYGLATAFLLGWFLCGPRPVPFWFWFSAPAIILSIPFSISRSLLFFVGLIFLFTTFSCFLTGRKIVNWIGAVLALSIFFITFMQFGFFQDAFEVFNKRWQNAEASESQGQGLIGILDTRIGGPIDTAVVFFAESDLFGKGIGLSTNVGAVRFTGQKDFIVAEGALPAIIGELGPFLGVILIAWRLGFAFFLLIVACKESVKDNLLPLILAPMALQGVVLGVTSQSTGLGFIVISAGFMLSSFHRSGFFSAPIKKIAMSSNLLK